MEELLNLNPNQSQYEQGLQDQQDKFKKVISLIYANKKKIAQSCILHEKNFGEKTICK